MFFLCRPGLSGIINTVSTDKAINTRNYVGEERFNELANIMKKERMSKECTGDTMSNAIVESVLVVSILKIKEI